MTDRQPSVNATTAPLGNVLRFGALLDACIQRPAHLPGLGVFYGHSGYGKTWSAVHAANKTRARYVECGESWTRARFLAAVAVEVGVDGHGRAADVVDRIILACESQDRPLIIDEADHVVRRGYLETVREIADRAGVPIILVGEEALPQMIAARSERTHNRVLSWVAAEPVTPEDVAIVARLYYPDLVIAADLIERVTTASAGRIRRAVVNLHRVATEALAQGWDVVGLTTWGDRDLYTGQVPSMRAGERVPARGGRR
ncbi:AAA family ATPase [Roseospira navarrensis]|uniref:AAA family ATPase n=1 Tax=Roseospira navarrensis TaxID=140058 RepID=A0A7X1ZE34_9PROT|nr:ATP-binding protein [Roseospira navarrensis]MQX36853.1 AAA family ATPase [Roseospira navarrensis]